MNSNKMQPGFALFSFLPAFAYWYLEEHYPAKYAALGGVCLAILEILIEKFWFKKVHKLSILNFWLIVGLGSMAFWSEDGKLFKLQPFFSSFIFAIILWVPQRRGKGLIKTMVNEQMEGKEVPLPGWVLDIIEKHLIGFLLLNGLFMGYLALYGATSTWLFFKTIGFYAIFGVYMIFEILYLRYKLKKWKKFQYFQQIRSSMKSS